MQRQREALWRTRGKRSYCRPLTLAPPPISVATTLIIHHTYDL